MLKTLLFCFMQVKLCSTLLQEAPETLQAPVSTQFIDNAHYLKAEKLYVSFGHWDS